MPPAQNDYVQQLLDSATAAPPAASPALTATPPAATAPSFESQLGPVQATDLLAPTTTPLHFGQWIPAASLTDRSRAITERAHQTPLGSPIALTAPYAGPVAMRVLSSNPVKIAGAIAAEHALESLIPDEWRGTLGRFVHGVLSSAGH